MAREVRTGKGSARQNAVRFYKHLTTVWFSLVIICGAALGYLWFWLERYEEHSINGAISAYFRLVDNEEWDEIYNQDCRHFTELNSRETYIEYLKSIYTGRKTSEMKYSFTDTDGISEYYNIHYDNYVMAALELRRTDDSDVWHVRTIGSTTPFDFDVLDDSLVFTINSVPVESSYYHVEGQIPAAFDGYELAYRIPEVTRYPISSLVGTPDVKPASADTAVVRDYTSQSYYIGRKPTSEQGDEFAENMYDTAVAYCKFVTRDGTRYSITSRLYPGTNFYDFVSTFDNSWVTDHDSIQFENVKVYDLLPFGDTAFIGTISFDYKLIADDVTGTYSQAYQMFFVKNGQNYWKLLNMAIISDSVDVDVTE
ncbi:MAG: hypothetical protein IKF00_09440 [Solobacterium sp.]|jgi:hypothetical protein|nr:hypothetical protein [Solobacterium sp.]MBR3344803.1 hypothetical protein [Solobacterium sp.]